MSDDYTKVLLREVLKDLKRLLPETDVSKAGLTWSKWGPQKYYCFQYQDFYWEGSAWDASEARAKAWERYMRSKGLDDEMEAV